MSAHKFAKLMSALRDADAALSAAIEQHNAIDSRRGTDRQKTGDEKKLKAICRAESRAHDMTSDALYALCKYQPTTPEEFSEYLLTILNHWRVRDCNFDHEPDRDLLVSLLTNVNGTVATLVFRGGCQ